MAKKEKDKENFEDIDIITTTENKKTIYKAKMLSKYIDTMEHLPNQSFTFYFEDYIFIKELFKDKAEAKDTFEDKLFYFANGEEVKLYTDEEYNGMILTLLNDKLKTIFRKIQASYKTYSKTRTDYINNMARARKSNPVNIKANEDKVNEFISFCENHKSDFIRRFAEIPRGKIYNLVADRNIEDVKEELNDLISCPAQTLQMELYKEGFNLEEYTPYNIINHRLKLRYPRIDETLYQEEAEIAEEDEEED